MKRTLPVLIASAAGLVIIGAYFVPAGQSWGDTAGEWFKILAAVSLILGGGNLLKLQLQQIAARKLGWGYAAITAIAFVVTLVLGMLKVGVHPMEQFPEHPWSGEYLQNGSALWWLYEYIIKPITTTMFGMLAFFVASAAFRAFRAKNLEATLLLITAIIVLLGRTYVGEWLTGGLPEKVSALKFANLTTIIQEIFVTSGTRAIKIGIALGVVATSLRIILGMDKSYLGSEQE